ncbi:BnaC08g11010D [Brassica napus]|uniref:BnaC08g11010D protein n=2 Tax=Brassica napus TaxID=3708 RepID=A0A078F646_BRANA|nr:BnaC08g11010D [Brassica napus]
MIVPSSCLLCDRANESRSHLFFDCLVYAEVWTSFFTHPTLHPPHSFDGILTWVLTASPHPKVKFICKLLLQAVCYVLWRERNLRLHNSTSRSAHLLIKEIQVIMKAKLIGMDRRPVQPTQRSQSFQESHLVTWFTYFQP